MIELYFLLFYIPRKVRALAKDRGQNVWAWSLKAIGAWLGTELLLSLLISVALPLEGNVNLFVVAIYLSTLFPAFLAANAVINKLRALPTISANDTPWR